MSELEDLKRILDLLEVQYTEQAGEEISLTADKYTWHFTLGGKLIRFTDE